MRYIIDKKLSFRIMDEIEKYVKDHPEDGWKMKDNVTATNDVSKDKEIVINSGADSIMMKYLYKGETMESYHLDTWDDVCDFVNSSGGDYYDETTRLLFDKIISV